MNKLKIIIISIACIKLINSSAPISDFEDTKIPIWYPYNLIETDISCNKIGPPYCPMFPPGGRLSVFPNSEEKFQHALHNMHRMHYTPNATLEIKNVDITKWYDRGFSKSTYNNYYSLDDYCGKSSSLRMPLYWYSDANAAARFEAWDFNTCKTSLSSRHKTCNLGNISSIWSFDGIIDIPINRCLLFPVTDCEYGPRSSALSCEDGDNGKAERPSFAFESICGGNSCFKDSHCDPIFKALEDYVGYGFIQGMNGITGIYVEGAPHISYELPIAAHYDDRMKTKIIDRDGSGKYFTFILQYFHSHILPLNCYLLYDDTYTEMDIILDDISPTGRSQFYRAKFYPPDNCKPYKFICKKSDNSFVKLPEQDIYFFGTQMMEWEYTLNPSDGVDGVAGASLASLAPGYDCDEQHYYYSGTKWIVNGGPTLTDTNRIYYYYKGGTCRGCQYIQILQCWQTCIESDFNVANCDCLSSSDTPSPTLSTSSPTDTTINPTSNTPSPTISTLSPTDNTESPTSDTASPTILTLSPTDTDSPTLDTPSPTVSTLSPTDSTDNPTSDTASPTILTLSPTDNTDSPTFNTPSPTISTLSPTESTDSPTFNTGSPTESTESPTLITNSPTSAYPTLAPTITGYTCLKEINYEQIFSRVRTWDEVNDAGTYLGTCEEDFQAIYPDCILSTSNLMEYYYYFVYERRGSGGKKSKLYVYMKVCCGNDDSTFGPNYIIDSDSDSPYQANAVLIDKYESSQALNSADNVWTNPSKWQWKHYLVYSIISFILLSCIIATIFLIKRHISNKKKFATTMDNYYPNKSRDSKRNVIMDRTIQMHGFSSKPGPKHVALPSNIRDSTDGSTDGFTNGSQDYGINTMLAPPIQKLGHAVLPSVSIEEDTPEIEQPPPMFSGLPPPLTTDAVIDE